MIEAGERAPDFTLKDQDGQEVSLSDFSGKKVVLYFYPKAETPGCTKQACGVRDHTADYEAAGAVVLGVSYDKPERLSKFADKHALPFTLLSDPDHEVAAAYGAKGILTPKRSTFVIGEDGVVLESIPRVNPLTHDKQVLEILQTV